MSQTQPKFNGIAIGKMWKKTRGRDGADYFQGQRMNGGRFLLLPNPNAGQEGEGDYTLFVVPVEEPQRPQSYRPAISPPQRRAPALPQSDDPFSDYPVEGEIIG